MTEVKKEIPIETIIVKKIEELLNDVKKVSNSKSANRELLGKELGICLKYAKKMI